VVLTAALVSLFLDPEDGDSKVLQQVDYYLPINAVSHFRSAESLLHNDISSDNLRHYVIPSFSRDGRRRKCGRYLVCFESESAQVLVQCIVINTVCGS
jgi:hypothetical protein